MLAAPRKVGGDRTPCDVRVNATFSRTSKSLGGSRARARASPPGHEPEERHACQATVIRCDRPVCSPEPVAARLRRCGDDSDATAEASKQFAAPTEAPADAQEGGSLTVLAASDVDNIDPGATYYQFGYMVTDATQSRWSATRRLTSTRAPLLAAERADGLRRRQDDHLQASRRRQVLAAGQPRRRPRPTSSTRSSARCCRASPTATRRPT